MACLALFFLLIGTAHTCVKAISLKPHPEGYPQYAPGRFEQISSRPWSDTNASEISRRPRSSRNASATPTFCIYTTLIEQELPYLASWLNYYQSIGVQTFYLLNTFKEQHDAIAEYLRAVRVPQDVFLFSFDETEHRDDLLKKRPEFWDGIKDDFLINMDVDEYWLMPEGVASLPELLETKPADIYTVEWVMVVGDDIATWPQPPYKGYRGHAKKWMARTNMLDHVAQHSPALKAEFDPSYTHKQERWVGRCVHFWGRGFLDGLMKSVTQYGCVKNFSTPHAEGSNALQGVIEELNQNIVPERLRLIAFFTNLPTDLGVEVTKPLLEINKTLERSFVAKVLGGEFNETKANDFINQEHLLYKDFKQRLHEVMESEGYPAYGPAFDDRAASGWLWGLHERFLREQHKQ